MKAEEFNNEWSKKNYDFIGKNPSRSSRIKFAEDYHQHKIKSVLEQADEAINELKKVKDKYKTIYTIDVIKLLGRVKEQLLK